jgi:uncharacterized membrane protein YfhO
VKKRAFQLAFFTAILMNAEGEQGVKVFEIMFIAATILACVHRLILAFTPPWVDIAVGIYLFGVLGIGLLVMLCKRLKRRSEGPAAREEIVG